jgi:peptide/nickel transport system permease protein
MIAYTFRRMLLAIPVMGVVAAAVFGLLYLAPGDPALVIAGDAATPDQVERVRHVLHLDEPPVMRFAHWVWRLLHGDFGTSIFSSEPVLHEIGERAGATVSLIVLASLIAILIGVPFGILAAQRKGGGWDHALGLYGVLGFSIPPFVIAYLLAFLFASKLHWLPVQGFQPISSGLIPFLRGAILPSLSLSIVFAALIASVTRSSMLETLGQDYIRTAIAKGVGSAAILFRHALRNAAIPVVTIIGNGIPVLIGGAVVVESIFVVPGIGSLTVDAILHRDYPVIQAIVLISSLAYVLTNLAIDLAYTLLDPRIRY